LKLRGMKKYKFSLWLLRRKKVFMTQNGLKQKQSPEAFFLQNAKIKILTKLFGI